MLRETKSDIKNKNNKKAFIKWSNYTDESTKMRKVTRYF